MQSSWYLPWGHPSARNLFNELDVKEHLDARRKVSNVYSMSTMVSYEPYVDECTSVLCQRLDEFAAKSSAEAVNMAHWFQCYAFDVIGKITVSTQSSYRSVKVSETVSIQFSKRFGYLDAGEDINSLMKILEFTAWLFSVIAVFPSIFPLVFKLMTSMGNRKDPKGPAFLAVFAQRQIQEKRDKVDEQESEGPEDFVSKFLRKQKERPDSFTDADIRVHTGANIVAGSDTTGITLSAILYHLVQRPEAMQRLTDELDAAAASGSISNPITFKEAQSLPYLQAVIKESLRIHSATGFTMPRVVPKGGRVLLGRHFPEGVS